MTTKERAKLIRDNARMGLVFLRLGLSLLTEDKHLTKAVEVTDTDGQRYTITSEGKKIKVLPVTAKK